MTIINASDAKAYCLAIAQLIPLFLIALYVIDNSWVSRIAEDVKKRNRAPEDFETEMTETFERAKGAARITLEETRERLAELDRDSSAEDKDQASREAVEAERASLLQAQAVLEDTITKLEGSSQQVDNSLEKFDRTYRESIKKIEGSAKKLFNQYALRAVAAIFLGVISEIIVLWGAIGLISRLFAVAWGTDAAILIAGSLSLFTIDRLPWQSRTRFTGWVNKIWQLATVCIAQATFIWIFISVTVKN